MCIGRAADEPQQRGEIDGGNLRLGQMACGDRVGWPVKQTRRAVSCGKFMPRSVTKEIADSKSASRTLLSAPRTRIYWHPRGRARNTAVGPRAAY